MDVLHLFGVEHDAWTIQSMASALAVPQSTVYRTVRDLIRAGLLEPAREAHYRLGAAFVEFDRKIRLTDPLIQIGQPVLRDIVAQAHVPCVGLLSRLYDRTVMCVSDARNDNSHFRSSYERGRPMPLTLGATSTVILAHLPPRRLAKLLDEQVTAKEFQERLRDIRKRGYAVTRGEIDPGLVGIAAPVIGKNVGLTASLTLVVAARDADAGAERRLVMLVMSAAKLLSEALLAV
jgi:DNA-binding IclR family transcriptional regulator